MELRSNPLYLLLASVALSSACTESDNAGIFQSAGGDAEDSSGLDAGADDGPDSDGAEDAGEDDQGGEDDGGPKFDTMNGLDGGGDAGGAGCKKIDFLFVIDNSGSMDSEQNNLIAAFPQFVSAIESELPDATDYHIGVVKTDAFGQNGLGQAPAFPTEPCVNTWGGLIDRDTPELDWTGYGQSCGFTSGERWMTNTPSLGAEFACAGEVGVRGDSWEQQANAGISALSEASCNAGFLRDDALLVMVVVTDEDDDYSLPDPDNSSTELRTTQWFEAVRAAKGGVEENVVFVLISGGSPRWGDCEPLNLDTRTGARESDVLTEWARRFTNHHLGSVCTDTYGQTLSDALSTIESACDDFVPAG